MALTALVLDRRGPAINVTDPVLRATAEDLFRMGLRLDEEDEGQDEGRFWAPQGLTGTADAFDSETLNGRKFLILTSHVNLDWSDLAQQDEDDSEDRARLTVVDVTTVANEYSYCHVLLVDVGADGQPIMLKTHAGGVVWRANVLYVASGSELLEFNLDYLFDLHSPRDSSHGAAAGAVIATISALPGTVSSGAGSAPKVWGNIVRKPGGRYWAFGYRYVLVLQRRFTWLSPTFAHSHFAALGLARDGDSRWLISAPWLDAEDIDDCVIGWWRLNEYGYLTDRSGTVSSDKVADAGVEKIQGLCADSDIVWLCTSDGTVSNQTLATYKVMPEGTVVGSWCDWTFQWSKFGEGLTFAPSSDHLWNVTEHPGDIVVFCIDRSMTRGDLAD